MKMCSWIEGKVSVPLGRINSVIGTQGRAEEVVSRLAW